MADRWWAAIEVWPWPETQDLPEPVRDALTELGYDHLAISESDFDPLVTEMTVEDHDSRGRVFTLYDSQANGGSWQFIEGYGGSPSLTQELEDAGMAYVTWDDGEYEFAGTEICWWPTMAEWTEDDFRQRLFGNNHVDRPLLKSGELGLDQPTLKRFQEEFGDEWPVAVELWFAFDPRAWEPDPAPVIGTA